MGISRLSPPACRRSSRRSWQWLLVVGATAGCAVARAAEDEPRWGLAGNSECLWVYRVRTDPASERPIVSFAIRSATDKAGEFLGVPTPGLGGNIAWAVASGDAVHLIFHDGTHRSLRVRDAKVVRVGDEQVELPLPQNAVPLALGADSASRILYAVVPGAAAADLPWPKADASSDAEMTTTAPAAAEPENVASPALVQYAQGEWFRRAHLPPDLGTPRRIWLGANQGEVSVFLVREGSDDRLWWVTNAEREWGTAAPVSGVDGMSVVDVIQCDGKALIVSEAQGPQGAPSGLRVSRWESGLWVTRDVHGIPEAMREGVMAGVLGSHLGLGFVLRDAAGPALHVGLWSGAGEPVEAPAVVKALQPPSGFQLSNRLRLAIPYGVLTVLLAGVLIRRRRAIAEPAVLRETQAIVGVGRRAAAFALDFLLVLPLMYPFLQQHIAVLQAQVESAMPADVAVMALSFGLFWHWLAAIGIYVTYCIVFEATVAATPGKMFMHCRVADERGEPCRFPRIVIRNLLRLVEMFPAFDLLPPLVLILVTRKRQRLGDLLAGTIVVEQHDVVTTGSEDRRAESSEKSDDSSRES